MAIKEFLFLVSKGIRCVSKLISSGSSSCCMYVNSYFLLPAYTLCGKVMFSVFLSVLSTYGPVQTSSLRNLPPSRTWWTYLLCSPFNKSKWAVALQLILVTNSCCSQWTLQVIIAHIRKSSELVGFSLKYLRFSRMSTACFPIIRAIYSDEVWKCPVEAEP